MLFCSRKNTPRNNFYLSDPILVLCSVASFLVSFKAQAQVIPDNSLGGESSVVTPNVTVKDALADLIEGGAIRNHNLFHSFSEFNIPDGNRVYFASPDGIANILTRVTGNNLSEIFGTLGVDGAANLFLLNPNGIVFGENAALDVNGSFLATTAESYIFENGFEYSASNPETPPLLTINIPVGLQFGSQAESIVNQSFSFNDFDELVGLEIPSEQNLTLVGGDILFDGGTITASNGFIEIGSVAPHSLVKIIPTENNWTLDYTGVNSLQNIDLIQAASINSSGDGAGNINIQANNLNVLEGSTIVADNYGAQDGGSLNINTQESVTVDGTDADGFLSYITTDVYDSGKGAELNLNTKTLQVTDGAYISADNYGSGDGGDLTIKASDSVSLMGSEEGDFSYISTDVHDSGDAGDLNIETGTLEVKDNTFVSSDVLIYGDVLNMGDGGNLTIKASDSVEVVGTNAEGLDNSISSAVFLITDTPLAELNLEPNSANGGNLTIETGTLKVANGGYVTTDNFGSGTAGSLTIYASESVEVIGNSAEEIQSYISNSVYGTSDGGDLNINTGTLRLVDDAYVDSITYAEGNGGTLMVNAERVIVKDGGNLGVGISGGEGNAGNLIVNASESVEISGGTRLPRYEEGEVFFVNSNLFATANSDFSGNGGEIIIETPQLKLFAGGKISTSTSSEGNGGNIFINAQNIEIADAIQDSYGDHSGITSMVDAEGTGNGGKINILTNNLRVVNGGLISVNTFGQGNAGDINIQAHNIYLTGVSSGEPIFGVEQDSLPSQISAFSQGNFAAGLITIDSTNLNLSDRAEISVSNLGQGNSGNLNIIAQDLSIEDYSKLSAEVNGGEQGNINLTTNNIFLSNGSISAEAKGASTGSNISINNTDNLLIIENSKIIANATQGNGGNINITTQGYFISANSLVSASSQFGLDGNIEIENINSDRKLELDSLPIESLDASQQIATGCGFDNDFIISDKGGLTDNPTQHLRNATVWQDLRTPNIDNFTITEQFSSLSQYPANTQIVEATTWTINQQGKVELIAHNSEQNIFNWHFKCLQGTNY